jgi:hypothetical protein
VSKSMTSPALRYVHLSEADLLHPLERATFESGLCNGLCNGPAVLSISVTLPVGARENLWLRTARANASFIEHE